MTNVIFNPTTLSDICIDLYHGNRLSDPPTNSLTQAVNSAGIQLFILKASQSTSILDPAFAVRREACETLGIRRAAYHYLSGRDGVAEANFFLSTIGSDFKELGVALDLEASTTTIGAAREWVNTVQSAIGRPVIVYSGAYFTGADGVGFPDTVLNQCPLWVPEYGTTPRCPLGWSFWKLHQWTDGSVLPSTVPGLGAVDRSRYAGTVSDFTTWWDSLVSVPISTPIISPVITPAIPSNIVLTFGMTCIHVGELQKCLNSHGANPQLDVDDNFGRATLYAVEQFQFYNGLIVDGLCGIKTQKALELFV